MLRGTGGLLRGEARVDQMTTVVGLEQFDPLPATGQYFIHYTTPNGARVNELVDTKERLIRKLETYSGRRDLWYAYGGFDGVARDPAHPNRPTRKKDNVVAVRCVAVDVDLGKDGGHATKDEVLDDLDALTQAGTVPEPTYVVESGNGFHIYWVFDRDISQNEYNAVANALVQYLRANAPKIIVDHTSTTGAERILRWPGTYNMKPGRAPFLMALVPDYSHGALFDFTAFLNAIGGPIVPIRTTPYQPSANTAGGVMSNSKIPYDQPLEVISQCNAMNHLKQQVVEGYDRFKQTGLETDKHEIPYLGWMAMMAVLKFFGQRGRNMAYALSRASQNFDEADFHKKLHTATVDINTFGCTKFTRDNGISRTVCIGCAAWIVQGERYATTGAGADTQPADINASVSRLNFQSNTAPPITFGAGGFPWVPLEDPLLSNDIPPANVITKADATTNPFPDTRNASLPLGYWLTLEGELGVVVEVETADNNGAAMKGKEFHKVARRAVWPVGMVAPQNEEDRSGYRYMYRAVDYEPARGVRFYEFDLGGVEQTQKEAHTAALSNRGISLVNGAAGYNYLQAFFERVRDAAGVTPAKRLPAVMGWQPGGEFAVGGIQISAPAIKRASYYDMDTEVMKRFGRAGDPDKSMEAMMTMMSKGNDIAKVFMLGSLGSPLLHLLGGAGENTNPVVAVTGEGGMGKSLLLKTCMTAWGSPDAHHITEVSTQNSMYAVFSEHHNLPVFFDEIGNFSDRAELGKIIHMFTNGLPKGARTGENKTRKGAYAWNTALHCTSNLPLHDVMLGENGEGAKGGAKVRRILEVSATEELFGPNSAEVDTARDTLKENYGFLGPTMMHYVTQNLDAVRKGMVAMRNQLKREPGYSNFQSYYVSYIAAVMVTARILERMGLMTFNSQWLLTNSAAFSGQSVQKAKEVQASIGDVLGNIVEACKAHTYKFVRDANGEKSHGNNPDTLNQREAGRIRYVDDITNPNDMFEEWNISTDWLKRTLLKMGRDLSTVIDAWKRMGYTVFEDHVHIEAGAFNRSLMGAAQSPSGRLPQRVTVVQISR